MQLENTALLFPGQGSQEIGMSRALAEADSDLMNLWKMAEKAAGIPLREIYWDNGSQENSADFDNTRNVQPALVTASLCCWLAVKGRVKPVCAAGHSLGEYSALGAARVLDLPKLLELVALRGRLMAEADPRGEGGMAAVVKLDQATVEKAIQEAKNESGEELLLANYNSPAQFVVSGGKKAIEKLQEKVRVLKGRAISLAVSGAFHSPMMREAAEEMGKALQKAEWRNPDFALYCNFTARASTEATEIKKSLLQQMTAPVRWIEIIQNQYKNGASTFLECGPKNVLTKLVPLNLKDLAPEGSFQAIGAEAMLAS